MSDTFTPPPVSSWEGPGKGGGFTPPPVSSWQGPAKDDRSPLTKAAHAFWEGIGGQAAMDILAGASRDPAKAQKAIETVKALGGGIAAEPGRVWDELVKTGQSMLKGDVSGTGYHLAGAVPVFGAGAQQVAQDVDKGRYAEAVGHTAALFAPFAAHEAAPIAATAAENLRVGVPGAVRGIVQESTAPYTATLKVKGVPVSVDLPGPRIVTGPIAAATTGATIAGPKGAIIGGLTGAAVPIVKGAVKGYRAALADVAAADLAESASTAQAARAASREAAMARAAAADAANPRPTFEPIAPGAPQPAPIPVEPLLAAVQPEIVPPEPSIAAQPAAAVPTVAEPIPATVPPEPPPAPAPLPVEPPPAAPSALDRNAQARQIAAELENLMRVDRLTDYLKANKIPPAMVAEFGPEEWRLVAGSAQTGEPTLAQIAEIRANYAPAAIEAPSNVPAEAAQQFKTAKAKRTRKPAAQTAPAEPITLKPGQTPAEALAEMMPESVRKLPAEGPTAPTASETRVQGLAQHLADSSIPIEDLATLPDNPAALDQLTRLGRALEIDGAPTKGEIPQIVEAVRKLRAAKPPAAAEVVELPAELARKPVAEARAAVERVQKARRRRTPVER